MTTRICIGIPTFQRLDSLRDLLAAVGALAPLGEGFSVGVAVFDNDPQRSAEPLVWEWAATAGCSIAYVHVTPAGLSTVRNAALDYAAAHADLLAMLDDDERPEAQWLNELLRVRAATNATVVVGPVRAVLPADVPAWVRAFRECEYPAQVDGASLVDGWSSNFLLSVAEVSEMALRFDTALNRAGGEDQLFFRQLLGFGGVICYAANAIVWESLPAARRSLPAILKRSFRRGGSLTVCDRRIKGTSGLVLRFAKGGGLVVIGFLKLLPTLVMRGKSPAVMTLCEIARGLGMLAAFTGLQYESYGQRAG